MSRYPLIPDLEGPPLTVTAYVDLQVPLLLALAPAHSGGRWGERIRHGLRLTAGKDLDPKVARQILMANHGYGHPTAFAAHRDDLVDPDFEAAADAIQWGDLECLRQLLDDQPYLVGARSPFVHHAMLLHLVSANGVEVERQLQSPANGVEVARLLLARGADPDAWCDTYGGGPGQTPMHLLVSSCVPAEAGVQAALVGAYVAGGAKVDGVDDDSLPLWTAVAFGYREAAEALVACGARVDNVCLAAALGDLDRVKSYTAEVGRGETLRMGKDGAGLPGDHLLDYALIWAAAHRRRSVVEWLLAQTPDLTVRDPIFSSTARGAAAHMGHGDMVALIEAAAAAR